MPTGKKKPAIGIVGAGSRGYGSFGKIVADNGNARLAAFSDPNRARREAAAALFSPAPRTYGTIGEMTEGEKLDGVIVTSPDFTHEEVTLAVIAAGLPVMVDKPLATTAAGCLRILEAAEKKGLPVLTGFNLRHLNHTRQVREIIDSGEIGGLMFIENREFYDGGRTYMSRWNRRREWSGGLWVHKGSHDFDILNWWNSGGLPVRVSSFAGLNALRPDKLPFTPPEGIEPGPTCSSCACYDQCPDRIGRQAGKTLFNEKTAAQDSYHRDLCMYLSDKDTHDNGVTIVEYDNNVRASHAECFVANFSNRLYTLVGDRGVLEMDLGNPFIRLRPRWKRGRDQLIGVAAMSSGGHGGSDPVLVENFLSILRGEEPDALSRASARDGLKAVAVGEAAEISWREHRTVEIAELVDPALLAA